MTDAQLEAIQLPPVRDDSIFRGNMLTPRVRSFFSGSFSNLHSPHVWVSGLLTTIYGYASELPQRPIWGADCQVARNRAERRGHPHIWGVFWKLAQK